MAVIDEKSHERRAILHYAGRDKHMLLSADARRDLVELRAYGYAPTTIAILVRAAVDALDAIPPDRL